MRVCSACESLLRLATATAATTIHSVAPRTRLKIRLGTPTIAGEPGKTNGQTMSDMCVHEHRHQHALGTVVDPHHEHPVRQQPGEEQHGHFQRRRDGPTGGCA